MGEYYFHLDQLTVGYNGKPLIDQIQVGIHKGEIVTLIGPNGSGKSTILKSITRQLKILGGKVLYEENDLHKLSYKELSTRMAVVLTERMRPELMTCHDIVATGRYPYTGRLGILSREDEDKVDEAMRIVHAENWEAGILMPSVTGSVRESFWQELSARNRRSSCWMSLPLFWISVISWNCYPFSALWQKKRA